MEFYILNNEEQIKSTLSTDEIGEQRQIVSAKITEKLNSYEILSLEIDGGAIPGDELPEITEENIIIFNDSVNGPREYTIIEVADADNGGIIKTVEAELSAIELRDEIVKYEIKGVTNSPSTALGLLLANTRWVVGSVDNRIQMTTFDQEVQYKNVLEAMDILSKIYECEIYYEYEFAGNMITARKVSLNYKEGVNRGKRIEVEKDLLSIKRTVDTTAIKTAIYPTGNDGTTIADIVWSKAAGDPLDKPAGQLFLSHPGVKAKYGRKNPDGSLRDRMAYSKIEVNAGQSLINLAYKELMGLISPKVTYEVDAVDLYTLSGEEHEFFKKGDIVTISDFNFKVPITVQKRAVELERDLLNGMNNKYVFGDSFDYILSNGETAYAPEDSNARTDALETRVDALETTSAETETRLATLESGGNTGNDTTGEDTTASLNLLKLPFTADSEVSSYAFAHINAVNQLEIKIGNGSDTNRDINFPFFDAITGGVAHTLSFSIPLIELKGIGYNAFFYYGFKDSAGNEINVTQWQTSSSSSTILDAVTFADSYAAGTLRFFIRFQNTAISKIQFDNLKFEVGPKTGWRLHEQDPIKTYQIPTELKGKNLLPSVYNEDAIVYKNTTIQRVDDASVILRNNTKLVDSWGVPNGYKSPPITGLEVGKIYTMRVTVTCLTPINRDFYFIADITDSASWNGESGGLAWGISPLSNTYNRAYFQSQARAGESLDLFYTFMAKGVPAETAFGFSIAAESNEMPIEVLLQNVSLFEGFDASAFATHEGDEAITSSSSENLQPFVNGVDEVLRNSTVTVVDAKTLDFSPNGYEASILFKPFDSFNIELWYTISFDVEMIEKDYRDALIIGIFDSIGVNSLTRDTKTIQMSEVGDKLHFTNSFKAVNFSESARLKIMARMGERNTYRISNIQVEAGIVETEYKQNIKDEHIPTEAELLATRVVALEGEVFVEGVSRLDTAVQTGEIIAKINESTETTGIDVGKLNLSGAVTDDMISAVTEGKITDLSYRTTAPLIAMVGESTLNGGFRQILFETEFLEKVDTAQPYFVFLQPLGNAFVWVSDRSAASFSVESADTLNSIGFLYRIEATPKVVA